MRENINCLIEIDLLQFNTKVIFQFDVISMVLFVILVETFNMFCSDLSFLEFHCSYHTSRNTLELFVMCFGFQCVQRGVIIKLIFVVILARLSYCFWKWGCFIHAIHVRIRDIALDCHPFPSFQANHSIYNTSGFKFLHLWSFLRQEFIDDYHLLINLSFKFPRSIQ